MQAPKSVQVGLKLPFFEVSSTWEPNDVERAAAWELYVEMITRIAVVPLPAGHGLLREALSSHYALFATTRDILRRHGPVLAEPKRDEQPNFGYLAVSMLNFGVRPMLARWHPALQTWETARPADRSPYEHEKMWPQAAALRAELETTRRSLGAFAGILARACGVPDLTAAIPAG